MDERFQKVEDDYFRLKGQLAIGRITRGQFGAALKALMIQDAQGRWWSIGAGDSKWYMNDGTRWVQADPPGSSPVAVAPPPPRAMPPPRVARQQPQFAPPPIAQKQFAPPPSAKSGGGCGYFLWGCLAVVVLLLIAGVGVYAGFQNGAITRNTVLNLVGLGPGDIEVDNFRDEAIQVNIAQIDVSQDSTPLQGALTLNAFDLKSFRAQNPGKYRVDFALRKGGALGTCALNIKSGD
ncbi:MAG: hypothetical protein KGJ80_21955, partial [Chloroflexota bacterium]|nr:hypothetical protein [Chloroflexota bacterium]